MGKSDNSVKILNTTYIQTLPCQDPGCSSAPASSAGGSGLVQCVNNREHGMVVHQDQLAPWVNLSWAKQEEMCRDLTQAWPHQGDPNDLSWVTVGANSTGVYDEFQKFGPV